MSVQPMSSAGSGLLAQVDIPGSPVGLLCRDVPLWVSHPPIESVVFAWGASEDHQLGLDTEQDIFQPKVVESLLGIHFMGRSFGRCPLVGGSRNTLALDADGGLWSWGWNDRGTLGHGHRALQRKPAPVEGLTGIEVIQAAIGGWHCLALDSDGQVYCWGGNEYQQCGLVAPEDDQQQPATAAAAAGVGQASSSSGGANGNSHARQERSSSSSRGGGAAANGSSCYGVLPAVRDILVPCRCMPGLRVKQVACGGMNSVVLTESGEVWTWGEPWGDFLAMDIQRAPRKVDGAVNIAAIACGGFHNLALVADGSVLSWGTNDYGQLGNGSTIYSTTPVEVCDLEEVAVADIAAGGWHSMALTADGQIYVWGRGEYGRLGIGDRTGSSKLRPHKIRGLEEHVVVQVAAGGTHSCCVTSSGRMFIWGRASYGRLGLGSDAHDTYSPVEVQLPGGHQRWKIAAATAGGRHTMCLAVPVRDGIKGTSQYGGNSEGPSRAASVVNEPINPPAGGSGGSNGRGANNSSTNNGSSAVVPGSSDPAGGSSGQQQRQQAVGKVYDPFATQQQQQQQVQPGSGSNGAGGRSAEDSSRAERGGSGGSSTAAGVLPGGSSSRCAVGVSSPYQPGGALPHGPTLSMQSSYSLVNSPGSSILGGSSPATNFSTAGPAGLAATGPWAGPGILRSGAAAAAAAPGSSPAAAPAGAAAAAAGGPGPAAQRAPGGPEGLGAGTLGSSFQGSSAGVQGAGPGAGFSVSPLPSPPGKGRSAGGAPAATAAAAATVAAAAAALSPRGGAVAAAGSNGGSSAVPGAAAMAAAAAGGGSGSSEVLPLGVEAVHAATEAAVQHVSAVLHGLSPGTPGAANSGALHAMLTSHGPLAAAAAAAAAGGGTLKPGQGSSISPRGIPPPMSPSQRGAAWDAGSSLREFVGTGDAYDVTGRGDSIQWQHQDVALELQERQVLVEDDAIQQELQEEQQREADEAALEEAEERQEEEVRLRRQEHQQQLREAHMRQRHQKLPGQSGSQGAGSNHGGGSYTGLGFVAPGSSGSSGGRMGSSQGRSSFAAAAAAGAPAGGIQQQQQQQQQQMRRSHSHQQLAAAVAAAAAEMGGTAQSYSTLQRYGSSPQTGSSSGAGPGQPGSGSQQQHQHQQQAGVSSVSFGGASGPAAGAAGRLVAAGAPVSFSAGVAGVRRMGAGGSVWPAVARVDSDASQEGLVGLVEGVSPADSPRSSAAAGDGGPSRGVSQGRGSSNNRRQVSRGSQGSISGDSCGAAELGASPPSARYDVGLGERYVGSFPGREQLHHLAHT